MSTDNTRQTENQDGTVELLKKLSPRYGWFKVYRKDRARIIEHCEGAAASALSVWDALSDLSNESKANTFSVSVGIIRSRAGVSRRTAFSALELLETLGMISRKQNPVAGKKTLGESTYTLLTQPLDDVSPSANDALPQCNKRTTPSARQVPHNLHRGIKKSPKGDNKKGKRALPGDISLKAKSPESSLQKFDFE